MRIAQVAPLSESVPPKLYGGTERDVHYLAEELLCQGHEVTLYASGDSRTNAELRPSIARALRLDCEAGNALASHLVMLEHVFRDASEFDIIHFHLDYLHFPYARREQVPHVTTLHNRLDIPGLAPMYREYSEMPLVSISNVQRAPLPWLNWKATVYHGIPLNHYPFHERPGSYLAFVGRMSPEKGPDRAIEIARRAGVPIKLAAKVDQAAREYFEEQVRPRLNEPGVEFVGEIGEAEKGQFLGAACALVFPIDWPEPFGLIMIEAMACGTPVIAFRHGAVAEVVQDDITGFVVSSVEEAVSAVKRLEVLNRRLCRKAFEQRFSSERMAKDYLAVYERVLQEDGINLPRRSGLS
jgi:glycosyltransferase involved in cell wall biosynthesis